MIHYLILAGIAILGLVLALRPAHLMRDNILRETGASKFIYIVSLLVFWALISGILLSIYNYHYRAQFDETYVSPKIQSKPQE